MSQVILISGLQRSGTTLIHRLLDGHSQLWVMPGESALHPNKYLFPDLSAAVANRRFNLCYEFNGALPVWDLFRSSKLAKIQKNFEVDNPDFDLDFEAFMVDWRAAMEAQRNWSEGGIIEAFLRSLFAHLKSHPRRNSDRYVLKTPRLGFDHGRFFELFPQGRLILMNRRMQSYVGSEVRRSGFDPRGPLDRARRIKLTARRCAMHKFSDRVIAELAGDDRVRVVDFEALTRNAEQEMQALAEFLGIGYEATLTVPSVYGKPWISNSSFGDEREGTRGRVVELGDRRSALTLLERRALEVFDFLLPPATASSVFETKGGFR